MDFVLAATPDGRRAARRRPRLSVQGFTLIEVLVALAVLTIALTAIFRLQSQTLLMSEKSRFFTVAPLLAQARINAIDGEEFGSLADGSGDFATEHPGFSWSMRIEEVPLEMLQHQRHHFVRIELTITHNDDQSYVLRTYRLYPE